MDTSGIVNIISTIVEVGIKVVDRILADPNIGEKKVKDAFPGLYDWVMRKAKAPMRKALESFRKIKNT